MKNHWLQIYKRKKNKIWTAEFSKNSLFKLKPRKAIVNLTYSSSNSGYAKLLFSDALKNSSDHELFDFISESSQTGMQDMISRFKKYSGISVNKIEVNYELSGLEYDSIGTGSTSNDLQLGFKFKNLIKINTP